MSCFIKCNVSIFVTNVSLMALKSAIVAHTLAIIKIRVRVLDRRQGGRPVFRAPGVIGPVWSWVGNVVVELRFSSPRVTI
jgi:hypothetical protein